MASFTTPATVEDFRDLFGNRQQMAAIAKSNSWRRVADAYALEFVKSDPSVSNEIRRHFDSSIANMAEVAGGNPKNAVAAARALMRESDFCKRHGLYSAQAPGAALDGIAGSKAELVRAAWHRPAKAGAAASKLKDRLLDAHAGIRNSFGSIVPADGGFLIPEEFRSDILMAAIEMSIVRQRALVLPMASEWLTLPGTDETTRSGSVLGGLVAYWSEEASALTSAESQAAFAGTRLEAKKLVIFSEAPDELVADGAGAFEAVLNQALPAATSYFEDRAFYQGTGVGEPAGWQGANAVIKIDPAVSSQIAFGDVLAMYVRMMPTSLSRAVWVANINTLGQLLEMSFEGAASSDVPTGAITFDPGTGTVRLLGRPVLVSEHAPALGSDGALGFCDFGYYAIGDRQAMTLATSIHPKFNQGITSIRLVERVDGRVWLQSAITPENGSSTVSPFVLLSGTHT